MFCQAFACEQHGSTPRSQTGLSKHLRRRCCQPRPSLQRILGLHCVASYRAACAWRTLGIRVRVDFRICLRPFDTWLCKSLRCGPRGIAACLVCRQAEVAPTTSEHLQQPYTHTCTPTVCTCMHAYIYRSIDTHIY